MDGQKILEEKIEAAKKDLEDWKSGSSLFHVGSQVSLYTNSY
jgi:hypothetical protein